MSKELDFGDSLMLFQSTLYLQGIYWLPPSAPIPIWGDLQDMGEIEVTPSLSWDITFDVCFNVISHGFVLMWCAALIVKIILFT